MDEDWYEGQFVDKKEEGKGTRVYHLANGRVYTGEWKDGKREGEGTMRESTLGDKYVGQWFQGEKHGNGMLYEAAEGCIYEGEWAKDERSGAAPPTVYRALDFLLEQGLVHRIESMNAFVGCGLAGRSHAGQFLICDACGRVAEVTDAGTSDRLAALARAAGFTLKRQMVELHGLCPACTTAAGEGDAA